MESEKVKDIKKALDFHKYGLPYIENSCVNIVYCKDILTYINELEDENERYKQSCGAIGQNSLTIINQLKDRIAELEKENKIVKEVLRKYGVCVVTDTDRITGVDNE